MCRYLMVFFCLILYLEAIPIRVEKKYSTKALDFMRKFGYLNDDNGDSEALYTEEGLSNIIRTLQRFGGIQETGVLDNATFKLMTSKRCGVPDIIHYNRQKRFNLSPDGGWNKRKITYFLANWSPKLGEKVVAKNIQLALNTWAQYGNLNFYRSMTPDADIIVVFGRNHHGDSFPFDGAGQILAHAFFPQQYGDLGGDIHFDEDEAWVDNYGGDTRDGTDFFTVALHELGHSLGLAHSDVPNSIMSPYYRGFDENNQFKLTYDDIIAMYQLYINRRIEDESTEPPKTTTTILTTTTITSSSKSTTRTTYPPKRTASTVLYEGDFETVDEHKKHETHKNETKPTSSQVPQICDTHFDAMAVLRGELFIFKSGYIWRMYDKGKMVNGYPVPLNQMFPDLPKHIQSVDAAYERLDGMMVLFTGNIFWVYNGERFIENSPKPITYYGLPQNLNTIDAVQIWNRNKKTYIYSGNQFWRYNETTKLMDDGYPKNIELWRRIPENLDAAITWKDVTYFFKGELFWSFDNHWVIATDESPLPTAQIWFGCPETLRMNKIFNN